MSLAYKRRDSLNLMAELTSKLLDSKLMERYGTSLVENMGSEFQKTLNDKYNKLNHEFATINKDDNSFISKKELSDFLNSYQKV